MSIAPISPPGLAMAGYAAASALRSEEARTADLAGKTAQSNTEHRTAGLSYRMPDIGAVLADDLISSAAALIEARHVYAANAVVLRGISEMMKQNEEKEGK